MKFEELLEILGELADEEIENFDENAELYPMNISLGDVEIPVMLPLANAFCAQFEYGPLFRFVIEEE